MGNQADDVIEEDLNDKNLPPSSDDDVSSPDGGWGWVIVLAAFLVYAIVFGTLRCQSVLFVPIMESFETDFSSVGWVAAIASSGIAVAGILSAPMMTRFGHRPTIMAGGLMAAVASISASFAPNMILLDVTAGLLTGVGLGMSFVASPVVIGFYFKKRRALATNLASMGASVGTFALCPLNAHLIKEFALPGHFLIFGAIYLNLCVCGALMRPLSLENSKRDHMNGEGIEADSRKVLWSSLFRHKAFIVYCLSQVVFVAGFLVGQLYIVPFAEQELGISKLKAPLVVSIMAGTELFSRIIFGFLGDFKRINRLLMFASVLLLLAVCGLIIPFTDSFASLAAVAAVTGLFQGGFSGISIVVLADIVGMKMYGTALGISTLFNGIGTLVTPPLVGIAVDTTGRPSIALFISCGLLFLGAILTFAIHVVMKLQRERPN
ncbi:monocarboxylate transporter 2-like [Clavelina lepadiformis]|uniref:Major facilitator superfamily (MFS) profile domain-containing protein n=1 Tax=Clavelina lepadiformis TaxID=159417 RepID=A0ABP0F808_CLALP